MVSIQHPELHIEPVPENPGRRRVRVSYVLLLAPDDTAVSADVVERASLRSRDLHDAPVPPRPLHVVIERSAHLLTPGAHQRELDFEVDRVDLDVEQDWWRHDQGGRPLPIAELVDHVYVEVEIVAGDEVLAGATTPVVSGSWGALGQD